MRAISRAPDTQRLANAHHTAKERLRSDTMTLSRLFGQKQEKAPVEKRPDGLDRLPPGQYLTKKWPVLSYERTPKFDPTTWRFTVKGLVEEPFELTWEQFLALPRVTLTADFHCV